MIGENIARLRKSNNLSQEELAEKVGVTRQTISNWELGETTPDLNQCKKLSKIFNINLDSLTTSNEDIIVKTVTNTENISIKILRIAGITLGLLVFFVIVIIGSIILFTNYFTAKPVSKGMQISCNINNIPLYYQVEMDLNDRITAFNTNDSNLKGLDYHKYKSAEEILDYARNFVEKQGGTCESNSNVIVE